MTNREKALTLQNEHLSLSFLPPSDPPFSKRFDSMAVVRELVYRGRHTFCVPEQYRPERRTTNGVGLCGEFFLEGTGALAKPGEYFPKPGVGLLLQHPQGGDFNRWRDYQTVPFPVEAHCQRDRAVFRQRMSPCLGFAGIFQREVLLEGERLRVVTTVTNTGEKGMRLREYQHNFVAVDMLPIGPGYKLEIPFDGGIGELQGAVLHSDGGGGDPGPVEGVITAEGQTLSWNGLMEGLVLSKTTTRKNILPCDCYCWKLSNTEAGAWIRETVDFIPDRLVLWAIEHCVCAEMYVSIDIPVGESRSWERIWDFGEES